MIIISIYIHVAYIYNVATDAYKFLRNPHI